MHAYLVSLDLRLIAERLSGWLGCRINAADVRELLEHLGLKESDKGWLTADLRPLLLACVRPGKPLFGPMRASRAA